MVKYYDTEENCKDKKMAIEINADVEKFVAFLIIYITSAHRDVQGMGRPPRNRQEEYDLIFTLMHDMERIMLTIEVKNDIRSIRTENAAFEQEYKGRPSALVATKAKYWIHIIRQNGKFLFMAGTVNKVRKMVKKYKHDTKRGVGDVGSGTVIDLVKKDIVDKKMTIWYEIDNPTNDESLLRVIENHPDFKDWDLTSVFNGLYY